MTILHKYLYDNLSIDIVTGFKPVMVNNRVHNSKVGLPLTKWDINFGTVSDELKNAIESAIMGDPNSLYIESPVGPGFNISKRVSPLGIVSYYISYLFEYAYYGVAMDREVSYTDNGTHHVLDIGVSIPINQSASDVPVVVPAHTVVPRKLLFLDENIREVHKANTIFEMKLRFTEVYKPLSYSSMYIVGVSDVNHNSCS